MVRFRRSSNLFVLFSDRVAVDLDAFFTGSVNVVPKTQALGISLASGKTAELAPAILGLFAAVDSMSWHTAEQLTDRFEVDSQTLDALVRDGFLISSEETAQATMMREMDGRLDQVNWNPHQALSYVMARWADTFTVEQLDELTEVLEDFDCLVNAYGEPPPHYHQVEAASSIPLPVAEPETELLNVLLDRYTARVFRTDSPMPPEHLARLLYFTFGAQAEIPLARGFTVLRKTSPSGGAMHPVEAYPLIMNVQGIDCGIYHYNVGKHCLDLIKPMTETEAREVALQITTGQDYFASADIMLILTGRFKRTFWKYRNHAKARRVVELDTGHLSQTFYLIATQLGYGPFITAAIMDGPIEELLNLPFLEEGAIAVVGCGTSVKNQERLV